VPKESLQPLDGGEQVRIGDVELDVFYTPGHASHHVTYWDRASRTAVVGDTAGIRVQGDTFLLPATPPPDIDVEIWNQSLDTISSWNPERLFLTHFGFIENPGEHIRLYKERLAEWSALTQKLIASGMDTTEAEKAFVDSVASEIKSTLPANAAEHYIFNGGLRLSWLGLLRYVKKKDLQGR
jgi:glyoxylase-like metal-dependent hydrolase (beta-lactamase superfamily II)